MKRLNVENEDEKNILAIELDLAGKNLIKEISISILALFSGPFLAMFLGQDVAEFMSFPPESFEEYFLQVGKIGLFIFPFMIYYFYKYWMISNDCKSLEKEIIQSVIVGNKVLDNNDYASKDYFLKLKTEKGKMIDLKVSKEDFYRYQIGDNVITHLTPKARIGLKIENTRYEN